MNALWDPTEENSNLYETVHRHSEGMISLTVTRDTASQEIDRTAAFDRFVKLGLDESATGSLETFEKLP